MIEQFKRFQYMIGSMFDLNLQIPGHCNLRIYLVISVLVICYFRVYLSIG